MENNYDFVVVETEKRHFTITWESFFCVNIWTLTYIAVR